MPDKASALPGVTSVVAGRLDSGLSLSRRQRSPAQRRLGEGQFRVAEQRHEGRRDNHMSSRCRRYSRRSKGPAYAAKAILAYLH
jgi:hypothetical protein